MLVSLTCALVVDDHVIVSHDFSSISLLLANHVLALLIRSLQKKEKKVEHLYVYY